MKLKTILCLVAIVGIAYGYLGTKAGTVATSSVAHAAELQREQLRKLDEMTK